MVAVSDGFHPSSNTCLRTNIATHRIPTVATAAVFEKSSVWIIKTILVYSLSIAFLCCMEFLLARHYFTFCFFAALGYP